MMQYYVASDELYHHGILGMKWGVRRYQNADGSLTTAGEKRYGSSSISRRQKRKLRNLKKSLNRNSGDSGNIRLMANASVIKKEDYEKASAALMKGKMLIQAGKYVENFEKDSVDLYLGKQSNPTMRVTISEGGAYSAKFLDKNSEANFNAFAEYYDTYVKNANNKR